ENNLVGAIVRRGVAIVGVVERAEVRRDADGITLSFDVLEHARIPHSLFTLSIGTVVIEIAELPDERALADSRPTDDRNAHRLRIVRISMMTRASASERATRPPSREALRRGLAVALAEAETE